MLKSWGTWLGLENENVQGKLESKSVGDNEDRDHEVNKPPATCENEEVSAVQNPQVLQKAKGFGGKITV